MSDQGNLLDLLGSPEEVSEVGGEKTEGEVCVDDGQEKQLDGLDESVKKPDGKNTAEESKFDDTWTVLYAGKTRFVRDLRLKKYDESSLKKVLSKEFPEMGVVKVVFNFNDKKKAIVPVVRGDTKG